jgi:hypothetical protein
MAPAPSFPLSRQAVAILREIHKYTGHQKWIFLQLRTPMSENCLTTALQLQIGLKATGTAFEAL